MYTHTGYLSTHIFDIYACIDLVLGTYVYTYWIPKYTHNGYLCMYRFGTGHLCIHILDTYAHT